MGAFMGVLGAINLALLFAIFSSDMIKGQSIKESLYSAAVGVVLFTLIYLSISFVYLIFAALIKYVGQ